MEGMMEMIKAAMILKGMQPGEIDLAMQGVSGLLDLVGDIGSRFAEKSDAETLAAYAQTLAVLRDEDMAQPMMAEIRKRMEAILFPETDDGEHGDDSSNVPPAGV